MLNYLVSRLSEASTWRGIALLVAALGVHIAPELQESIITTGIAVAGLVGVVTKG